MRANKIQTIWDENQTVICGWMNTESPYIAEMMGVKGMDAVCLDMQHGVAHPRCISCYASYLSN